MKKLLPVFLLLACLLSCQRTFATHIAGADISYKWVSGNTYEITCTLYRDCRGVAAPSYISLNLRSKSCNSTLNVTLNMLTVIPKEITAPCNSSATLCNGGTADGIQEYVYRGNVTFPKTCSDWIISYEICCRNCLISTIKHPSPCNSSNIKPELYVEATLDNLNFPHNNSPRFADDPVVYLCANYPYVMNHGVVEDDGDSLVYSLIPPKTSHDSDVTFISPFDSTNFLTASSTPYINPLTGEISLTPSKAGEIVVSAMLVREYRNGKLVGSTIRDMQFWVINCSGNFPPTASGINGTSNYSVTVKPGDTICFTIFSGDANTGQIVSMQWNNGIPNGTFVVTPDSLPTGTFCWVTAVGDARATPYTFTVNVQDNNCPYNAVSIFNYNVYVDSGFIITKSAAEYERNMQFLLYPNPGNQKVTAVLPFTDESTFIVVRDITGRTLQTIKPGSKVTEIKLGNMADGLYFVSWLNEKFQRTTKLVVSHDF